MGVCKVVYLQIDKLFSTFLKEKQYLEGSSPATIRAYSKSWLAYKHYVGCTCQISDGMVRDFMVAMTSAGEIKASSANAYARSINSFLSWMFENGHTPGHLRVPLTATLKRVLQNYSQEEVRRIVTHKPRSRVGKRVMALLFLLIDTGCRVSEALSLTRKAFDFEGLMVTLIGKGNKQRRVPVSFECWKHLYHWLNTHDHEYVFCTESGGKLRYDNVRHDFLV